MGVIQAGALNGRVLVVEPNAIIRQRQLTEFSLPAFFFFNRLGWRRNGFSRNPFFQNGHNIRVGQFQRFDADLLPVQVKIVRVQGQLTNDAPGLKARFFNPYIPAGAVDAPSPQPQIERVSRGY